IIAVLVSLLLPALARAREAGRAAVCLSNTRQLALAGLNYAQDYKVIWSSTEFAFHYGPDGNPKTPGIMFDYLSNADTVAECPKNKRRGVVRTTGTNMWGGHTALNFDYTMCAQLEGAFPDIAPPMAYLRNPGIFDVYLLPPRVMPPSGVAELVQ